MAASYCRGGGHPSPEAGEEFAVPEPPAPTKVVNIMDALKRSRGGGRRSSGASSARAEQEAGDRQETRKSKVRKAR